MLSAEVGITTLENLKNIILGLGMYFPPVDALSKKKHVMRHGMKKQAHVQIFDCESVTLKEYVNMFERMEKSENIYEGVL